MAWLGLNTEESRKDLGGKRKAQRQRYENIGRGETIDILGSQLIS
jgi:hypothetical protein